MANTVVIGMQWGDEGKGKIVDLICPAFDVVVRFQGGNNAGHTVKFADRHFALHLVPSGIVHEGIRCVLGNGMVIDPQALFEELENLKRLGVDPEGSLFVSDRAHVLLPPFAELNRTREQARGKVKIGTTARGIGPAYENKAARSGLRVGDLWAPDLEERVRALVARLEREIVALGGEPLAPPEHLLEACRDWRQRLAPHVSNTESLLNRWIEEGLSLLFEGAQGTLLDLDHGTYPYVTSSNASAGGACTGTGVPPGRIDGVLGVLKAYTTRVGGGPFVTEIDSPVGEFLRRRGNEFGTTTGRPRRCGWLDFVTARYSRRVNGVDTIALTKLDVLDEVKEIQVCVAYRIGGEILKDPPARLDELERAEPVYRRLEGWQQETVGMLDFAELPREARDYVAFIEEQLDAPVSLVSTGPRREETFLRSEPRLTELTGSRLDAVLAQRVPPS
ncbi:MAG: adenylosuccinate synthase [Thermoanaerobaculia bacterium]